VSSTSVMATDESHFKVEFKKVFLFFRFSDSDKKVNFCIQKSLFKQFQQVSRYTNTKKTFFIPKRENGFFFTRKTKGQSFVLSWIPSLKLLLLGH
jgi:hypothetical protein